MQAWPPVKAWTSVNKIQDNSYFVAINYGISKGIAWVNLVSVLDGRVCIKVKFEDLIDKSIWEPGWLELKSESIHKKKSLCSNNYESACLHPSVDSGLLITTEKFLSRPWFP